MTIFDEGLSTLTDVFKQSTEIAVTYYHGKAFFFVSGTRGSVSYGTIAKFGAVPMDVDYREYIFRMDALPDNFTPSARDVIVDLDGKWEAFNGPSNDCWRYCDPNKKLIRVFTRRIK